MELAAPQCRPEGDVYAGGVSVGDKDFIKPILERKGTVHFGKVCIAITFAEFSQCLRWDLILSKSTCTVHPGQDEAGQAAHVCNNRGLCAAVQAAGGARPAWQPREQHRDFQPGHAASAQEAVGLEGATCARLVFISLLFCIV